MPPDVTVLSRKTSAGLILAGALFGAFLWLLSRYDHVFTSTQLCYALALTTTFFVALVCAARRFSDRRLWCGIALLMVIVGLMAGWLNWNAFSEDGIGGGQAIALRFALCLALLLFIAVPWLQCWIHTGAWRGDYTSLYEQLWHNGITVLIILLINGLSGGLVVLALALFHMLDLTLPYDLTRFWQLLLSALTGALSVSGVVLARTQPAMLRAVQHIFTQIISGLLPMMALISLLFMAALPFVGLDTLSQRVSSNGLLNTLTLCLMLMASVVWYPQRDAAPYPRWLGGPIQLALGLTPFCAAAALYALALRVAQYGWTPDRVNAALVTAISAVWSLGMVWALWRGRGCVVFNPARINLAVLLLLLAGLFASHSPLVDPYRISVNHQLARYHSGQASAEEVRSMFWSAGRRGHDAQSRLLDNKSIVKETTLVEYLEAIAIAQGVAAPDRAFFRSLEKEIDYKMSTCLKTKGRCLLASQDMNGDGHSEYLLFDQEQHTVIVLSRETGGHWQPRGSGNYPASDRLPQMLAENTITSQPKAWRDVLIGEQRVNIHYYR
ncbi:DUF4153 domain-containing protein [Entomohabitans teleogrylli]|uniref:DUF4153 domain-containing protein n=1 Tax=Entomohabitans teleogrylli TaxID=1384589 RepID=UPI00073D1AFA|nr:DUF4153 domain-containing protein [Entomohabitans teleogrylli]